MGGLKSSGLKKRRSDIDQVQQQVYNSYFKDVARNSGTWMHKKVRKQREKKKIFIVSESMISCIHSTHKPRGKKAKQHRLSLIFLEGFWRSLMTKHDGK